MAQITVAVDAMGGDNAPGAVVEGSLMALREMPDLRILLCGPTEALKPLVAGAGDVKERIEIREAPEVIGMHDAPVLAIRRKTGSSMVVALMAVKNGEAQAALSAGSTGALLAGGMLRVGRIKGIDRPALSPVLPGRKNPFLLIDAGANVDCQSEYLRQFGLMGSIYMEKVMGVSRPRVGLLNIGAESEKGSRLYKEAHQLMANQSVYNFTGNIEARDVPNGDADVVVADGFDGNIVLKYTEGLASSLVGMLKDEMMSSTRSKLGALLLKPALRTFKKRMDYEEYGGSPFLGVSGVVIKAHGSSGPVAFKNALRQAHKMVSVDISGQIAREMEKLAELNDKGESEPQ